MCTLYPHLQILISYSSDIQLQTHIHHTHKATTTTHTHTDVALWEDRDAQVRQAPSSLPTWFQEQLGPFQVWAKLPPLRILPHKGALSPLEHQNLHVPKLGSLKCKLFHANVIQITSSKGVPQAALSFPLPLGFLCPEDKTWLPPNPAHLHPAPPDSSM